MQLRHDFTVWMEDVRSGLRMTDKALLEILGDMAMLHGMRIGQGINTRHIHHLVWMTLNWKMKITRRPKAGETITAVTWARDYTRVQAYRDYLDTRKALGREAKPICLMDIGTLAAKYLGEGLYESAGLPRLPDPGRRRKRTGPRDFELGSAGRQDDDDPAPFAGIYGSLRTGAGSRKFPGGKLPQTAEGRSGSPP